MNLAKNLEKRCVSKVVVAAKQKSCSQTLFSDQELEGLVWTLQVLESKFGEKLRTELAYIVFKDTKNGKLTQKRLLQA